MTEPADVLLNLVPRPAPELVRPDGVLVSITVPEGRHFVTRNDPGDLAALVELVDAGWCGSTSAPRGRSPICRRCIARPNRV